MFKIKFLFEANPQGIRRGSQWLVDIQIRPLAAFHMYTEWSSMVQCVGFVFIFTSFSEIVLGRSPYDGMNLERFNLRAGEIEVANVELFKQISAIILEFVSSIGTN